MFVGFKHAVDPARHRHAGLFHHGLGSVAALHPFVIHTPNRAPVLPRAFGKTVVPGQRFRIGADIGRALDIVVTAEYVRPAAGNANVAERELEDAKRAHIGVTDRVLGDAHAPNHRARTVLVHGLCHIEHVLLVHPGDIGYALGSPLHDFLARVFHAVDAVADELLVFPAVLEDVIEHAPDEGNVGTRANAHEMVGLGSGASEARIHHDHLRALLLGVQHVQHRHRMRLRGVAADEQHRPGVLHVVVGVGHRTITPGVRHPGHRRRVADARLVIAVVGAPE